LEHQNFDNTIIFNKKYHKYQDSNKEDILRSIENKFEDKEKYPISSVKESGNETYWESIDRIIDNKLKINNQK
jgi:hypothetical protein